jgi:nickel-dependent lactate racemase
VSLLGRGSAGEPLDEAELARIVDSFCAALDARGQRVLVLVPDATRTCPVGRMFRLLHERLSGVAARLDFLVALGTHPPLDESQLLRLFDLTHEERARRFSDVGLLNHAWRDPKELVEIGTLASSEIKDVTGGLFDESVRVTCNRRVLDCDRLVICGPVFPHEVAGFSGGNKYIAPGIAGAEIIDFFHWLGAVITNREIIGRKRTPVREVIDRVAGFLPVSRSALCMVVRPGGELAGLFAGDVDAAWSAAADLSEEIHIVRHSRVYDTVLSCAPEMYDELWVGGKCMYKLEPVVADGGRLIIYAPHIRRVSATHGELIERIGYHVRDYFLGQWERFRDVPGGVMAHSTHVKGSGSWREGREEPRIEVVLATGIPEETCRRIGLEYLDPACIDPSDFAGREEEGVLLVRDSGESLHRLSSD